MEIQQESTEPGDNLAKWGSDLKNRRMKMNAKSKMQIL